MNGKATLMVNRAILLAGVLVIGGQSPIIGAPAEISRDRALPRGPIHESFAQPLRGAGTAGKAVSLTPPTMPVQAPATKKPAASALWLPGYWAWEPAAKEHVWVPGIWRISPPGMRWLPGYWGQTKNGWRWVRGFWFPANQSRLQYLPDPPPPKEEPSSKASADRFTVPGYWNHTGSKYVWKQGYQAPFKAGWIWNPAHYVWTPRGSLFAPGYWDYAIERRGEALLPLPAATAKTATSAMPARTLNRAVFGEALFSDDGHGHFCFGDYFAANLAAAGLTPWYAADEHEPVEPIYVYERWRHQGLEADWPAALAQRYRARRERADMRVQLMRSLVTTSAPRLDRDSRRDTIPAAQGYTQLAQVRQQFEMSGESANDAGPAVLDLPLVSDSQAQRRIASEDRPATEESLPGVVGRQVPGVRQRALPGAAGRAVPGVEADLPDVAAPGVDPREIRPRR